MPKVLLTQELVGKKNVRTVVDGQQRIRSILEFVSGSYTVLGAHNSEHAGKIFSNLDEDTQAAILQYEIGVDLLYNVSLSEMLDIFARINTYSVTLNAQEKLNAKYIGVFKTNAYELGHEYAGYFLDAGILTQKTVNRMSEAQLASDLLVAVLDGVQTHKNIEKFYKRYENHDVVPNEITEAIRRFRNTMQLVGAIYPSRELRSTNWSRAHWFYTLFTCAAHAQQPLGGLEDVVQPPLHPESVQHWRGELDEISALYDQYTESSDKEVPALFARFINLSQRRTTDTEARRERAKFVLEAIVQ